MAHLVRLVYGSTTVNLYETTGSYCYLLSPLPVPTAARPGASSVEDVLTLAISAATTALIRAKVNAIELAFQNARDWTRSGGYKGARCDLDIQPDTTGTVYGTEVYDGWVDWDADSLTGRWAAKDVTVRVHVIHEPGWKSDGLTTLNISSNATTTATTSATIYNPAVTWSGDATFVDGGAGADTITAATGLDVFKDGDVITVTGSNNNDTDFTVVTGNSATTITLATGVVTAEGPVAVTIIGPVQNWVQIAAAQAANFLPTPLQIELTNSTSDADELTTIWIGSNVFANPTTLTPALYTFEAEDVNATAGDGGEADTESAYNSGAAYNTVTESGDAEVLAWRFDLSGANTRLFNGRRFRVIMRAATTDAAGTVASLPTAYIRAAIGYPSGTLTPTELGTSETTLLDASDIYQDLGEIYVPPWLLSVGGSAGVSLCIYVEKTGGYALAADYFQLICMDSFREYVPQTGGVEYSEKLVDYPVPHGEIFIEDSGGAKRGIISTRGEPIMLYPGVNQRLYFVALNADGVIGREMTVAVAARLRRATL